MPDFFEVADVQVALGGDINNTVPKSRVTAGEIAVLQTIHGNDAVFEVKPLGKIQRPQREERARLHAIYGGARDNNGDSLVEKLYPGVAARVFERLDELNLVDGQFAAERVGRGGSERQKAALADAEKGISLEPPTDDQIIPFAAGEGQPPVVQPGEDDADALEEPPADDPQGDEPVQGALN